jgi:7-carboxy-7-deazaguanine synthase
MKFRINEIFYSLQGEGFFAGQATIFIRLAGCNLDCPFCDTPHEAYREMTLCEIEREISSFPVKRITWTGGEPLLQLNTEAVAFFRRLGYFQAVETNGTRPVPYGINWITVSPKGHALVIRKANEVKYLISEDSEIPEVVIKAEHHFLSPLFTIEGAGRDSVPRENLNRCIEIIKGDPSWKLTMQNHKIWNVR